MLSERIDYDSLSEEEKQKLTFDITNEEIDAQILEQTVNSQLNDLESGFIIGSEWYKNLAREYVDIKKQIRNRFKGSKMLSSQIEEKSIKGAREWARKRLRERILIHRKQSTLV
jgi:hypothetical protein